jgi:hypothetical protein
MKGDKGRLDPEQKEKYRANYDLIFRKGKDMGCTKKKGTRKK